jgi:hypothetical protein
MASENGTISTVSPVSSQISNFLAHQVSVGEYAIGEHLPGALERFLPCGFKVGEIGPLRIFD